tara:strand:- start:36 stop:1214 length:1179 start_codon:yes stop_codon:yes gene_type:complete
MAIKGLTPELQNYYNEMAKLAYTGPEVKRALKTASPTERITLDPFKFSTLSYPRDVTQDMANGHYMLFYVNVQNKTKFKYKDFQNNTVGDSIEIVQTQPFGGNKSEIITSTGANAAEVEYAKRIAGKTGTKGHINTSRRVGLRQGQQATAGINAKIPTTTRITDSVAIYLPPNVQDSTSAQYQGMETGLIGLAAAGATDFVQAMSRNDFESAAKGLVTGTKQIVEEALKRAAGGLADALAEGEGGSSIGILNKAFGQANNPFMEVMFDKMQLRSFTYSFTFRPRNAAETDDVQAIIQLFRFHMAPELKGGNNRYLTLPSTFDIHYMYQQDQDTANENNFYSKIATCVLQSVDVDYTPNGVKSFHDGAPTQITMGLSFMETELITKDKVNQGF